MARDASRCTSDRHQRIPEPVQIQSLPSIFAATRARPGVSAGRGYTARMATPVEVDGGTAAGVAGAAQRVLRRVFGYDAFRGSQREIIEHVVAGGDALVLMPTGGGKSLCYQIPALVRDGVGVVISPLIALMQDQVDALPRSGVRAGFLNSTQDSARAGRSRPRSSPASSTCSTWRPKALARRLHPATARTRQDRALRDRRGALRVAVGARLPARLPRRCRCCTSAGRRSRGSR